MSNPVPDHVARNRARLLRKLIARKNESFRRTMIGQEIEVLVLRGGPENGWRSAISSNFVKVRVPESSVANEWTRVLIESLDENGLQASKITTAQEIN